MEAEWNKVRWRSRRGMLELDLLLIPFFDEVYRDLSPEQQRAFAALLDQEDPDLLAWFNGNGRPAGEELAAMVDMILAGVKRRP